MTLYDISAQDQERLDRSFTYFAPKSDQPARYVSLRATARDLAEAILRFCPPSRERSLALTELETTIMWANAAIARNE